MKVRTTYGDLKNGDTVFVQGHRFIVRDVRISGRKGEPGPGKDVNADDVIRFNGDCADADDSIKGTGYDGGVYGAYAFVPCTVERAGAAQ